MEKTAQNGKLQANTDDDYIRKNGRWYFQKRIYEILDAEEN